MSVPCCAIAKSTENLHVMHHASNLAGIYPSLCLSMDHTDT